MQQFRVRDDRQGVLGEAGGGHVAGVAAGDQQVGDFLVLAQVGVHLGHVALQEHVLVAVQLGVAEAVGAEGEAVLRGLVEDQLALGILVLAPLENLQHALVVHEPGLVQQLVSVVGVGLLAVAAGDLRARLGRRRGLVGRDHFGIDHPGLREHELEQGIPGEVLPVDSVQGVPGGQEAVDLDEKFAFVDMSDLDAIRRQHRDHFTEPLETRILLLTLEQERAGLGQARDVRIRSLDAAQQSRRQQVLGADHFADLVRIAVTIHHRTNIAVGDGRGNRTAQHGIGGMERL